MNFFKKLFGKSESQCDSPLPCPDEIKQNRLQSIYPYFKQVEPFTGESLELPANLEDIDKTKVYNISSSNVITKKICEDLHCFYVLDKETSYEIIQERHLTEMGINSDELHTLSLKNFYRFIDTRMKMHGDTNLVMFALGGNLEASLILVDAIWEQLEQQLGEEVIIATPARDILVATGKSNRNTINFFNEKAKAMLESGDHPLSKYWFIWKNKKWEVFESIV